MGTDLISTRASAKREREHQREILSMTTLDTHLTLPSLEALLHTLPLWTTSLHQASSRPVVLLVLHCSDCFDCDASFEVSVARSFCAEGCIGTREALERLLKPAEHRRSRQSLHRHLQQIEQSRRDYEGGLSEIDGVGGPVKSTYESSIAAELEKKTDGR